jgi:3-methyladenine DNA glycosylase AlkD
MHKAVGWLLREMGKRDPGLLRVFLKEYCTEMPRTALRYSIEKFSESERKKWLQFK